MQNPFALQRRSQDLPKAKSGDGDTKSAKSRASSGPWLVMGVGAALVFCHSLVEDYAQAVVAPDGLYIPDARYVVPLDTPPGNFIHTFRIYNARPWARVASIQADCGCTDLSWSKGRIAPLGWATFTVTVPVKRVKAKGSSNIAVFISSDKTARIASILQDSR